MLIKNLVLCVAFLSSAMLFSNSPSKDPQCDTLGANEFVIGKGLDTYLLPGNHPIKDKLDQIFSYPNILSSLEALESAGFTYSGIRPKKPLIIGRHPEIKGYLFKIYLDTATKINEFKCFTKRIKGALLIQKEITTYGFQNFCKVPKKWLYEIPAWNISSKKYVLVEDEMKFNKSANSQVFTTDRIKREHLDGIFKIVTKVGLGDSLHVKNIPLTDDGFIAFIDTEKYGNQERIWKKVRRFAQLLSEENAVYWEYICDFHHVP